MEILVVEKLPKTKSGKIIRACIKKIIYKEEYVIPKNLEDKDTLIDLIELLRKMKYK